MLTASDLPLITFIDIETSGLEPWVKVGDVSDKFVVTLEAGFYLCLKDEWNKLKFGSFCLGFKKVFNAIVECLGYYFGFL
ncbi:hypothetical protein [Vreelandella arcis]|uniref:Uncharacterized protein n=1 Tax=Vreelandella arcis TaxID=416873 RepID=A0A1H0J5G1_9GAMM|nr:hypothetical protein [Halomonas arcis]SDO38988.1 hypothetical protein SAMN04487951_12410 [Halomonas arcis]